MQPIIEETGLIRPTTITGMVVAWRQAEQKITEAHRMLHEADKLLREDFSGSCRYVSVSYDALSRDTTTDLMNKLKGEAWSCILEKTNARKLMSAKRQMEVDESLANPSTLPEITEANVMAMLESTYNCLPQYAEEMVKEVYQWLRPEGYRLSEYVTNQKSEAAGVGEKIIKTWAIERGYSHEKPWRLRYSHHDNFTALDNVFSMLDGNGVAKTHYGPIYDAIAACGADGVCETEYFKLKCYRNGNLHLQFKRLDLLAEFNRVAAGARLRNGSTVKAAA